MLDGLLLMLAGCGGIKPETAAALTTLTDVVGKGCGSGALSAEDCDAARRALERLGLDLTETQESAAAAWSSAAPLVTRIAEVLFRLMGA